MLNKIILVFIGGLIETFLYAGYIISVQKRQVILSSILMLVYMSIYLTIIAYAIQDVNTVTLILVYALSCGCGNFLRMRKEKADNLLKVK